LWTWWAEQVLHLADRNLFSFRREAAIRIALIAPPFIPVPPKRYGGTELFVANLARGLTKLGHDVVVYANGESEIDVEVRSIYPTAQWPITGEFSETLKEMHQTAWAIRDAADSCDIIQINNPYGLPYTDFASVPVVHTLHHERVEALSEFYSYYPQTHYVTISDFQRRRETMPNLRTIHHGIDLSCYRFRAEKQPYLSFLGRIAPIKGPHLAIAVAKETGIPLKIAGEIQPMFRDYFETEIEPHIDGKFIEYVGEADLEAKNELLGNSMAMVFPIQWSEPFGLVMIEAMACGTPVLALSGGSVEEVVQNGVSGFVCHSTEELARHARDIGTAIGSSTVRNYAEQYFSMERMASDYARLFAAIRRSPLPLSLADAVQADDKEPAAA
jgi:glycosyltransferase involved in cell wall biosynthesis